jgi:hypothetical protein
VIVIFICERISVVRAEYRGFRLCFVGLRYLFVRAVPVVSTEVSGYRLCVFVLVKFIC